MQDNSVKLGRGPRRVPHFFGTDFQVFAPECPSAGLPPQARPQTHQAFETIHCAIQPSASVRRPPIEGRGWRCAPPPPRVPGALLAQGPRSTGACVTPILPPHGAPPPPRRRPTPCCAVVLVGGLHCSAVAGRISAHVWALLAGARAPRPWRAHRAAKAAERREMVAKEDGARLTNLGPDD